MSKRFIPMNIVGSITVAATWPPATLEDAAVFEDSQLQKLWSLLALLNPSSPPPTESPPPPIVAFVTSSTIPFLHVIPEPVSATLSLPKTWALTEGALYRRFRPVVVQGLKSRPELNGREGSCGPYRADRRRLTAGTAQCADLFLT